MCDAVGKSNTSLRVFSDDVCLNGTNTDSFALRPPQEAYLRCYYDEEIVKTLYPNLVEQWGAMQVTGLSSADTIVDKTCLVWRLAPPWDSYVVVKNYVNPYSGVVHRQDVSNDQELLGTDYNRVRAVCLENFTSDPRYRYGLLFSASSIDGSESECVVTDGLTGYQWTVNNSAGTSVYPVNWQAVIEAIAGFTRVTVGEGFIYTYIPYFSCRNTYWDLDYSFPYFVVMINVSNSGQRITDTDYVYVRDPERTLCGYSNY